MGTHNFAFMEKVRKISVLSVEKSTVSGAMVADSANVNKA